MHLCRGIWFELSGFIEFIKENHFQQTGNRTGIRYLILICSCIQNLFRIDFWLLMLGQLLRWSNMRLRTFIHNDIFSRNLFSQFFFSRFLTSVIFFYLLLPYSRTKLIVKNCRMGPVICQRCLCFCFCERSNPNVNKS